MKRLKGALRRPLTLIGGAAALAILSGVLLAPALVTAQSSDDTGDDGGLPETVQDCVDRAVEREAPRMTEFLDELVADGIVDQAQADEIENRLRGAAEDRCIARLLYDRGQAVTATAIATGTLESEVLHAMRNGGTLAGYAAEHGVISKTDLIAAIMTPSHEAAALLVSNGELEQVKADELLAEIEARVAERINLTKDELPRRPTPIRDALGNGVDRLAKLVAQ